MPGKRSARNQATHNVEATVLVDYTNVFGTIAERTGGNEQPDAMVIELISELQRHVTEHLQLRAVRTMAFSNLPPGNVRGHRATGAWLSKGIEPRFSYAQATDEASTIDLAMEAMDIAMRVSGRHAFVILSGNHWFVPLVQRLQRMGHFVLMASLESPSRSDHLPADVLDSFLDARFLLERSSGGGSHDLFADDDDADNEYASGPAEVARILDEGARQALEVIEQYFGQYEEVYLTPCLRKLSEVLHDADEPKTLVTILEETGAVWLEKRRGFPHNYTVMLVNDEHPDVEEVRERSAVHDDEYYDDTDDDDAYEEQD